MGFGLVYVVDMIILIGEAKSGGGKSCERAKEYPFRALRVLWPRRCMTSPR